ncbi:hypothetical protein [Microtetraspora malaysiensis]|uniref:3'-5' exoribonuclease Rv2179c-like domain-containing protein n=1 Tax=Microtetraspora malaysiensis TaxID=161358 RepID=A0ABW6SKK8_9ACTN
MTKIFLDTEFLDDGERVMLISLGLVAETSEEYYAVSGDCDIDRVLADPWLRAHVAVHLPLLLHGDRWEWNITHPDYQHVRPRTRIAADVQAFMARQLDPEVWAYFSPFDHLNLCQLYGPMNSLPTAVPTFTRDLMQEAQRTAVPLPLQTAPIHHALADARHDYEIAVSIGLINPASKKSSSFARSAP